MITLILGEGATERKFEIAPYRLRELRLAAPFIEAMNATAERVSKVQAGETPSMTDMFDLSRSLCEVLAIGVAKVAPEVTADDIEELTGFSALNGLQNAVREVLEQSGLSSVGKTTAPLDMTEAPPAGPDVEASPPQSAELLAS